MFRINPKPSSESAAADPAVIFLIALFGYRRRKYLQDFGFRQVRVPGGLAESGGAARGVPIYQAARRPFVFAQSMNVMSYAILLGGSLIDSAKVFEQVRHLAASDRLRPRQLSQASRCS